MKHIFNPDIYESTVLICTNIFPELESQEYGACSFKLDNKLIKFRKAKVTPTKVGQFVTFWKRIGSGPIEPYDLSDEFDFLIVSVCKDKQVGQFVFSKTVLYKYGVISSNKIGGKRAIRVYPPWDVTDNSQAKKTQDWQINYFVEVHPKFDIEYLIKLLNL